jgi:hypothetical protein
MVAGWAATQLETVRFGCWRNMIIDIAFTKCSSADVYCPANAEQYSDLVLGRHSSASESERLGHGARTCAQVQGRFDTVANDRELSAARQLRR